MKSVRAVFLIVLSNAFLFVATTAYAAPYTLAGGKWGTPGLGMPGGTVTWSLMPGGVSLAAEFGGGSATTVDLASFLPPGYFDAIEAAFAAWSAVANIDFLEVPDDGAAFNLPSASQGMIRIGGHTFDGPGGTLAHGYFPPPNGTTAAGDIHFDTAEPWTIGLTNPGFDVFQVMAHEIGHAIGLAHADDGNIMQGFYSESFSGLQSGDIAGAQALYGLRVEAETFHTPEPGTLLLMGAGAVVIFAVRRRRAS